jgi:DNA-directed RNA polymerase subunit M/transcription elongation factor TFIIS
MINILYACSHVTMDYAAKELKKYLEKIFGLKATITEKQRCLSGNVSRGSKSRNLDDQVHIFRDCTKCGSTLRLPRKSGKHSVKCPRCSHSFYVRSK